MVLDEHDKLEISNETVLGGALLISEVVAAWGKHRNTIMFALLRGEISGRQGAGGIWIISRASCVAAWGRPNQEPITDWSK